MGHFCRIKTMQELREVSANEADCRDDEYLPRHRAKRRNIRTLWDDPCRCNYFNRSWKHYRKHQWKPKEASKKKKCSKFRGHTETGGSWRDGQHFKKKKVWAWSYRVTGYKWNHLKYYVHTGGVWEEVYGWVWSAKTPTVSIYDGYKITSYPEVRRDPSGVPYFTGKWKTKEKKLTKHISKDRPKRQTY